MQTISEKRYKLIPVTDLDIMYVGGIHDTITYLATDRVDEDNTLITVYMNDAKTGHCYERLICERRNILSFKFRERMLKIEDKTPIPVEVADAPTD